jgi:predicted AAA+ superfamily ATPase
MVFTRTIDLACRSASAFLFGPRMTGKTTLLRTLKHAEYFDLLDPAKAMEYRLRPALFWEELSALPDRCFVIVDEIQHLPELLNYVQMGIDRKNLRFLLSGSSARKLRRGGANLLGGRALDLRLHALTADEIGSRFSLDDALHCGTLPKISTLLLEKNLDEARMYLKSYVSIYIREEIQAEALTRNIGSFTRFLAVAGQSNAQVIEFQNISRDSMVPASTVKEYYQILEDTHLGNFLWPLGASERKKARPKFYFFDCGVVRAIQNRLHDPATAGERGFLFETWLVNELVRFRDYAGMPHEFCFWRDRTHEIDIVVCKNNKPVLAIECKTGNAAPHMPSIAAFSARFPKVPVIVVVDSAERTRKVGEIEVCSWQKAIGHFAALVK